MKGFADKALLLFPRFKNYNAKTPSDQSQFNLSVDKMIKYLLKNDIQPYVFNTDNLVDIVPMEGAKILDVVLPEDKMILEEYFLGGKKVTSGEPMSRDKAAKQRNKFKAKIGSTKEEKLDIFLKRNKFITKEYFKDFNIIVTWEDTKQRYYHVTSKKEDDTILITVSRINYSVSAELGGSYIDDPISLFNYVGARQPLTLWEV